MLAVATVNTVGYKLMLLLHILTVLVAMAPGFVWPIVGAKLKKQGEPMPPVIGLIAKGNTAMVHGPALVLVGVFGFGLVGMSDKAIEFSDAWISAASTVWLIQLGVVFGLLLPAQKKATQGDVHAATKLVPMFSGILHVLLLIMLYLMIFQPGG